MKKRKRSNLSDTQLILRKERKKIECSNGKERLSAGLNYCEKQYQEDHPYALLRTAKPDEKISRVSKWFINRYYTSKDGKQACDQMLFYPSEIGMIEIIKARKEGKPLKNIDQWFEQLEKFGNPYWKSQKNNKVRRRLE